jgi:hypothetical protein
MEGEISLLVSAGGPVIFLGNTILVADNVGLPTSGFHVSPASVNLSARRTRKPKKELKPKQ